MKKPVAVTRKYAESLAIQALTFIAAEPERLGRFLALTGIGPAEIRKAARESHFLAGVLEHVSGDDLLLIAFAADAGMDPTIIARAQAALDGGNQEREVP